MPARYEQEQAELKQELKSITERIDEMGMRELYISEFIEKARKYIEMPKLTPELMRMFIKRIEVYEKEEKRSRTCGNRIEIQFTFQSDLRRIRSNGVMVNIPSSNKIAG